MTTDAAVVVAAGVLWMVTHVACLPCRAEPRPARVRDERPVYGRRPIPVRSHTGDADRW